MSGIKVTIARAVRLCNTPIPTLLEGVRLSCSLCLRTTRHRLILFPKKTIALWLLVFFLLGFLIADTGIFVGKKTEDVKEFVQDRPPVPTEVPGSMKEIGVDTHVVAAADGQGDTKKTIYRDPPARPVPPQPDLSGHYPRDGIIISPNGEMQSPAPRVGDNQDINVLPPIGDIFEDKLKKSKHVVEADGQLIGWDNSLNGPNIYDPASLKKPPLEEEYEEPEQDGGLWKMMNPWYMLKGLGWGAPRPKKKPTQPPAVAQNDPVDNTRKKNGAVREFPKQIRDDDCDQCFVYSYKHMINPNQLCSPTKSDQYPEIIYLILSSPADALARRTIRTTYGRYSRLNSGSVRYVFIMGSQLSGIQQKMIDTESNTYGDILQGEFPETKFSSTYKVIGGLHWVLKFCHTVKFIVRTDDQTYVNVPSISRMLKSKEAILESAMTGKCNLMSKVIREVRNQWYVSYEEYPHGLYPPYCTASTYIMSKSIARQVVKASPDVPFFVFDDAYIGFIMKKLTLTLFSQASNFNVPMLAGCPDGHPWFTVGPIVPSVMQQIWDRCQDFKAH